MAQYKKHFVHHAVDGQLLLELNLDIMRSELKIAPLGHRSVILAAVADLKARGGPPAPSLARTYMAAGALLEPPPCMTGRVGHQLTVVAQTCARVAE